MKTFTLSCTYSGSFNFFDLIVKAESEEALRADINSRYNVALRNGAYINIEKIKSVKEG